jgi:tripartite-type tricarboxylate transporter receptor subunit TctC
LPEVPAVRESGVPGTADFEAVGWLGLMVPKATPAAVIERLNREVVAILKSDEVASYIRERGSEPSPMGAAAFDAFVVSEIAKWGKAVKASGAKAD